MANELTAKIHTALENYDEPLANSYSRQWFYRHWRPFTSQPSLQVQPGDPPLINGYFLASETGGDSSPRGFNVDEPIVIDVEHGPLRIKGTYVVNGDKLNAEIGLQAAPEVYLKLGELNGSPVSQTVVAEFDRNPDFYTGSIQIKGVPVAAGSTSIFGGLTAVVNWAGIGVKLATKALEVIKFKRA